MNNNIKDKMESKAVCPFCKKTTKIRGDPYYVTSMCIHCHHDFFHIPCGICNRVLKYKGNRENCMIKCHNKNLAYRFCSNCQQYDLYELDEPNCALYCSCGKNVESDVLNKSYSFDGYREYISYTREKRPINRDIKNTSIDKEVICELKDVFVGKELKFTMGDKEYYVKIEKGYKDGTKITYENEYCGDNFYDICNITFTLKINLPSDMKIINKNDIQYNISKSLFKTGKKYKVSIPHPEKDFDIIVNSDIISKEKIIFVNKGIYDRKLKQNGKFIISFI